jgi:hypothetical protein
MLKQAKPPEIAEGLACLCDRVRSLNLSEQHEFRYLHADGRRQPQQIGSSRQ